MAWAASPSWTALVTWVGLQRWGRGGTWLRPGPSLPRGSPLSSLARPESLTVTLRADLPGFLHRPLSYSLVSLQRYWGLGKGRGDPEESRTVAMTLRVTHLQARQRPEWLIVVSCEVCKATSCPSCKWGVKTREVKCLAQDYPAGNLSGEWRAGVQTGRLAQGSLS